MIDTEEVLEKKSLSKNTFLLVFQTADQKKIMER